MYYFSLATFQPFKNVKTIIHSPNIEKQAAVFVSWDWGHELVLSPSPTAQFFFGVYLPFSRLRQPTKYVLPLLSLYVSDFFPSLHFFPIGPQIQRDTEEVKEVMSTAWGTGVHPSPAALQLWFSASYTTIPNLHFTTWKMDHGIPPPANISEGDSAMSKVSRVKHTTCGEELLSTVQTQGLPGLLGHGRAWPNMRGEKGSSVNLFKILGKEQLAISLTACTFHNFLNGPKSNTNWESSVCWKNREVLWQAQK